MWYRTLQLTAHIKTKFGVETTRESFFVEHVVTDADGSLKVKETEEFTDSKTQLEFLQEFAAAKAKE